MEAKVLWVPAGVILTMLLRLRFPTNRLPDPSKAKGPDSPEANVLLTPAGVILTIVLALVAAFATNRLPARSKARPLGSASPKAKILAVPAGVVFTILLPKKSAS